MDGIYYGGRFQTCPYTAWETWLLLGIFQKLNGYEISSYKFAFIPRMYVICSISLLRTAIGTIPKDWLCLPAATRYKAMPERGRSMPSAIRCGVVRSLRLDIYDFTYSSHRGTRRVVSHTLCPVACLPVTPSFAIRSAAPVR